MILYTLVVKLIGRLSLMFDPHSFTYQSNEIELMHKHTFTIDITTN